MNQKINDLNEFLSTMKGNPNLHVNGVNHPSALLTVDFGQSIDRTEISPEEFEFLTKKMRVAAETLSRRSAEIRIQKDNTRGIYWASQS